ncbi:MAG: ABC transporter ATP-binding protein [Candidatus Binataceae bacterium]
MKIIEVQNLTKTFGGFRAVDDVSFTVEKGEIVALLGPNGAGKTTTIQMVLGLVTPSAGAIRIFGKPFDENREEILQLMNFTSPYVAFPYRLTVMENLAVYARMYAVANPAQRIAALLEEFGVSELARKPVSALSSGENTRVNLCKAMLNDPQLLLLDEPTAYLDPDIAWRVKEYLQRAQRERGITIVYSSHNMSEVERLCSRIIFLHRGRIIAEGSPLAVTEFLLDEQRGEAALEEVFLRVARGIKA